MTERVTFPPEPYSHRIRLAELIGDARQALADGQRPVHPATHLGRVEALLKMLADSAEQVLDAQLTEDGEPPVTGRRVTPGHPVRDGAGYDCACGECLAGRAPGVVKVRISGAADDVGMVAALLTDYDGTCIQVIDRSAPYLNQWDPGQRVYLTLRITEPEGGQS